MIPFLQRWGVPIGMTGAYAVLAWSSETSATGQAWMAVGLGFVYVVWFVFRTLTQLAALTRAVAVGDTTRVLELTGASLARRRAPGARAPLLVDRALAYELRGDWTAAIAAVDEARLDALADTQRPTWQVLASSVRIGVALETGAISEARRVLDRELAPAAARLDRRLHPSAHLHVTLSIGRVLAAEQRAVDARPVLEAVLDDVHAGAALRGIAHIHLARIAEDPAVAARHQREASALVSDENAWFRR